MTTTFTLNTDSTPGTVVVAANGSWALISGGLSGRAHQNNGTGYDEIVFYVYGTSAVLGFYNGGACWIQVDSNTPTSASAGGWTHSVALGSSDAWHLVRVYAHSPQMIWFDPPTAIAVTATGTPATAMPPHYGPSYTLDASTFSGQVGTAQQQLVDRGTFAAYSRVEGQWDTNANDGPGYINDAATKYLGPARLFYANAAEVWVHGYAGTGVQVHLEQDGAVIASAMVSSAWGVYQIASGLDTTAYHRYRLIVDCTDPIDISAHPLIYNIMLVGGSLLTQPINAPGHIAVVAGDSNTEGGALPNFSTLGNQSTIAWPYILQQNLPMAALNGAGGYFPVINQGISGRGMLDISSGFGLTNAAMIADVVAACGSVARPDMLIALGTNDLIQASGAETMVQFQAAIVSVYKQLRAASSTARIHFIGIPVQTGTYASQVASWNVAYEAAVGWCQDGDAAVFYHDPAGAGLLANSVDIDPGGGTGVHFTLSGRNKWIGWIQGWLSATWAADGGVNLGQWLGAPPLALDNGMVNAFIPPNQIGGPQDFNNTGQSTPVPSANAFTGPNSITLVFHDAANNPVPGVVFTIIGVGSAVANGSGTITVSLPAGTYTVSALPASGTFWPNTNITVSTTATFTLTGTAMTIPAPTDPSQTTAYLTTRDGQGNVLPNVTVTFQLVNPDAATDCFNTSIFTAASNSSASLQVPLLKNTQYQARVGGGAWVPFTTGSGATFALPEVLGTL